MAKGYTVGIASETKAFKQGVETGIISPVKSSIEALDRLANSRGPRALEEGMQDAQDATERLKRETKETADAIDREFRDSYRSARQSSDDATGRMGENFQSAKEEAVSNLSEVASSFDGDLRDMADGVQGFTGGLASALTPGIGIPLAVLGAIGAAWLTSWQENAEASEQRVSDMYDNMLESGQRFLTEGQIQEAIGDIGRDTDQWAQALSRADSAGVSIQTVLRAMVGDQAAIATVRQAETDKLAEQIGLIKAGADSEQIKADKIDAANLKYADAVAWLDQVITDTGTAADKAAAVGAAFGTSDATLDRMLRKVQDIAAGIQGIGDKTIRLTADDSDIQRKLGLLQGRTLTVNMQGQVTRIGNQVW